MCWYLRYVCNAHAPDNIKPEGPNAVNYMWSQNKLESIFLRILYRSQSSEGGGGSCEAGTVENHSLERGGGGSRAGTRTVVFFSIREHFDTITIHLSGACF